MAAKKKQIARIAKIQLIGGQAKPGPTLASIGINMAEFTKQFNDLTRKDRNGDVVPCVITAYTDKSFNFIIKSTPASVLLKRVAKIEKAGKNQLTDTVATITKEQALEVVRQKMQDLNAYDEEMGLRMIAGTAKQMGIKIKDVDLTPRKTEKANKKGTN